ncbi:beta-lactamase family protein [Mycena leptocephala]|nr:beta-lactamase family protein [Mycena leptocephala]
MAMDSFQTALSDATDPAKRDLLGAIGLVVDNTGEMLYHHAAGQQSLDSSAPLLNPDSVITLGSAGKFLTHIAALQCVERKLWLDSLSVIEPSDAEPGFILRPPARKITLRHLLTHTSGLGGGDEPLVEKWRASPAGAAHTAANADAHPIVKHFAHPLLFEPGAGYCYGGSAYFTGFADDGRVHTGEHLRPAGHGTSTLSPQTRADVREKLLQMVRRTPAGLVPVEEETRDMAVGVRDLGLLLADLVAAKSKILTPASVDLLFTPQLAEGSKALADLRSEKELENYSAPAGISPGFTPVVNWSMAGLLIQGADALPLSKMRPGTVTWNGMPNVVWAMHRESGVGMLFATQLVPVDDEKAVAVMMEFFKGAWATYGNST